MRRTLVVHSQLLLVSAIWGGHFVALRVMLRELAPSQVLALRVGLAVAFYLAFLAYNRGRLPRVRCGDWVRLALVSVFGVVGASSGVIFAQRYISAGVSSLLTTINPVFTALLAWLILGQKLTRRPAAGVALALAGFLIVLLLGGPGARFSVTNAVGVLLMASSPLSWAAYTVLSKPLVGRYPSAYVAAYGTILGALCLLPLVTPTFLRAVAGLSPRGWGAALFSGVLAMAVSYLFWYRGLRVLQPTQVAVYIYLVPVFGVIFAALLLGERLTPFAILGGVTILAGVIVTNTGSRRPLADDPPLAPAERPVELARR